MSKAKHTHMLKSWKIIFIWTDISCNTLSLHNTTSVSSTNVPKPLFFCDNYAAVCKGFVETWCGLALRLAGGFSHCLCVSSVFWVRRQPVCDTWGGPCSFRQGSHLKIKPWHGVISFGARGTSTCSSSYLLFVTYLTALARSRGQLKGWRCWYGAASSLSLSLLPRDFVSWCFVLWGSTVFNFVYCLLDNWSCSWWALTARSAFPIISVSCRGL